MKFNLSTFLRGCPLCGVREVEVEVDQDSLDASLTCANPGCGYKLPGKAEIVEGDNSRFRLTKDSIDAWNHLYINREEQRLRLLEEIEERREDLKASLVQQLHLEKAQ